MDWLQEQRLSPGSARKQSSGGEAFGGSIGGNAVAVA
eukprot:SAG22_NODE_12470_length_441_cov_1.871345_1_plen_36_part_01